MLNINPNGKKLILSLDGGGMRGLVTLGMLAELEAMTGRRVHDMFDMVAGTSTGAMIAAAICVGIETPRILDLYKTALPKAFGTTNRVVQIARFIGRRLRNIYRIEPFLEALGPLVEGVRVGEITRPILLMTTKDVRTSNTYFIVSAGPGAPMFAHWPLTGAVAASGAAPVYFPPVLGNLIDGGAGVYANPSLAAAVEAMEYIGASAGFVDGNVIHMSLGTGYPVNHVADGRAARFNIINWLQYVIGEQLDDSGLQQAYATRAIYGARTDFRRYNPLLTTANARDVLGVNIPPGTAPETLALDSRRLADIELMEAIGRAYARKLDWNAPGLMPWDTTGGHPQIDKAFLSIDFTGTKYR